MTHSALSSVPLTNVTVLMIQGYTQLMPLTMRSYLFSWLAALLLAPVGCEGGSDPDDQPLLPEPLPSACGTLLPKGLVVMGEAGAAVCYEAGAAALRAEANDLQLDGYLPVSAAQTLRLDRPVGAYGVDVTLPISAARLAALPGDLADPALIFKKNNRSKLVVLARFGKAPTHLHAISNTVVTHGEASALRFHIPGHEVGPLSAMGTLGDVATFQVAVPKTLSKAKRQRLFTYRAIAGVSMGGMGASANFFRHPEFFDAIGVLGADPGPDLTYSQGYIRDFFVAGFCTADRDGKEKIGQLCPATRVPLRGQGERVGDFEKMPVQKGEGIGLTLRRGVFLEANRDLVRALGNWAFANPKDPYLPPGIPRSSLAQKPADACLRANTTVLRGTEAAGANAKPLYDGRYNPDGKHDVITFCDAEADGMPGVFDTTMKPQTNPVQILLAVDVNGNQRRDSGEPVVLQPGEPFRDVGTDGKASKDEPGYDPVTNPDPAGDDYHYLKNPAGAEGNWRWDKGEPFDDFGIDGVKGKGCDVMGGQEGCFDYGEGNGKFDLNPGLAKWQAHDPRTLLEALTEAQLDRLDIYYDAGIRDFFNAHIATSSLTGALLARGRSLRSFDTFTAIQGLGVSEDYKFDALRVDLSQLGRRAYVRYGDPGITDEQAAMTGDGRHVGTGPQLIQRASLAFNFLLSRWPDVDRRLADDVGGETMKDLSFTMKNGRKTPYAMVLPPGYFDPENAELRYPVVYFGHGLGQKVEDLAAIGLVMRVLMGEPDASKRLPKAILVFLDGRCAPGGDVTQAPLSMDGDRCEGGAFYTNHPEGAYQGETMIQELDGYLRTKFRLKEPATLEVDAE